MTASNVFQVHIPTWSTCLKHAHCVQFPRSLSGTFGILSLQQLYVRPAPRFPLPQLVATLFPIAPAMQAMQDSMEQFALPVQVATLRKIVVPKYASSVQEGRTHTN